jgi:hypothetical protein
MEFYALLDQVVALLRSRGRVSYRTLKLQFNLNDEAIAALKANSLWPSSPPSIRRAPSWSGPGLPPPPHPL